MWSCELTIAMGRGLGTVIIFSKTLHVCDSTLRRRRSTFIHPISACVGGWAGVIGLASACASKRA